MESLRDRLHGHGDASDLGKAEKRRDVAWDVFLGEEMVSQQTSWYSGSYSPHSFPSLYSLSVTEQ